jgi:hypothetical protein
MNTQLKFELYEEELLNPLRGHELSEVESFVASLLLMASTHRPTSIKEIVLAVKEQTGKRLSQRAVKGVIRALRQDHKFPILSRKSSPPGYWWCASAEEMKAFIESFRKQALDELHTLSTIIKHNYPALQGQLKFDEVTTT